MTHEERKEKVKRLNDVVTKVLFSNDEFMSAMKELNDAEDRKLLYELELKITAEGEPGYDRFDGTKTKKKKELPAKPPVTDDDFLKSIGIEGGL